MSMLVLIGLLLVGGVMAWLAERIAVNLSRWVSLATVTVSLLYLLGIISGLPEGSLQLTPDPGDGSSWLLYLHIDWIQRFGIALEMAMDGLSLLLVVLTLLLGLVAIASSWSEIEFKPGLFQANLLWTLAGVCGVFLAMDLFLFFLFWEVMLIPMYLLIAIWGHEKREYAAMKFFIFTQVSGLLMLLAIVMLAWHGQKVNGHLSFSYFDLLGLPLQGRSGMDHDAGLLHRLYGEAAQLSFSHLVAGCPHPGTYRRQCATGRYPAENRCLWSAAFLHSIVSGFIGAVCAGGHGAGSGWGYLRRRAGLRPD